MSLYILTENIIDGDFTFPVEIEGSPSISTDEVTKALLIVRKYAVLTSNYAPLPQGTVDPIYTDCFLINETAAGIQGPITFFNRNYAQIPVTRTESRIVVFTKPGRSQVETSILTAVDIGWNQYGLTQPYTATRVATVTYTYGLNPIASVPSLTSIQYDGQDVDFTGSVYVYVGNVTTDVSGTLITEPSWEIAGTTVPAVAPSNWVVDTGFRRWRGPIFETEIVELSI